jgi:phage terminase large subunit-like protein
LRTRWLAWDLETRRRFLAKLDPTERQRLLDLLDVEELDPHKPWVEVARPDQLAPAGDWFVWLILAGRGWGKSRTAAEWSAEKARKYPGARIALVASTIADARDTMVEGESGLLGCLEPGELRGGDPEVAWNRSLGELYMANGSRFKTYSSEKPRRLRGPQHHFAWGDESAFWTDAHKGTITDTTWSNLTIGTRLPAKPGWPDDYRTQIVVATTPRPVSLLRTQDPDPARAGLMQRATTIITRGRTVDNLANLSDTYKAEVIAPLMGTRLGRQELDAELLEDREDALWRRDWIDQDRWPAVPVPDMIRVVVALDPAVSDGESSAETGIIVVGASRDGNGFVIADYTMRGTPQQVMVKAVWAAKHHDADRVVAEVNNGGDYIGSLLHAVDPGIAYRAVRATHGKATRAEPISALYEQHRIHHLGSFPLLEDQLCSWSPLDPESPDRLDALVWGFTDMKDLISGSWLGAYGVVKCAGCGHGYLSAGKKTCPHCGTAVPADLADATEPAPA